MSFLVDEKYHDDGPTLSADLVALWFFRDPDQYC